MRSSRFGSVDLYARELLGTPMTRATSRKGISGYFLEIARANIRRYFWTESQALFFFQTVHHDREFSYYFETILIFFFESSVLSVDISIIYSCLFYFLLQPPSNTFRRYPILCGHIYCRPSFIFHSMHGCISYVFRYTTYPSSSWHM